MLVPETIRSKDFDIDREVFQVGRWQSRRRRGDATHAPREMEWTTSLRRVLAKGTRNNRHRADHGVNNTGVGHDTL